MALLSEKKFSKECVRVCVKVIMIMMMIMMIMMVIKLMMMTLEEKNSLAFSQKILQNRRDFFFGTKFFPIQVSRLFFYTNFYQYQFRYKKIKKSWYWEFPVPVRHTLAPAHLKISTLFQPFKMFRRRVRWRTLRSFLTSSSLPTMRLGGMSPA